MDLKSSVVWVAGLAGVLATVLGYLMGVLRRNAREARYDRELSRAELEMMRQRFEDQIYKLTDRMVATSSRWQDANHIVVSGQKLGGANANEATLSGIGEIDFLKNAGTSVRDLSIERDLVFVLVPFHPDFQEVYDRVKVTCEQSGLRCMRGDEEPVSGDILSHILRMIVRARLIIAIVDGRNPNVFYELGIAHALGKQVLILSKSLDDVPFDIRSIRIVFYSDTRTIPEYLGPQITKYVLAGEKL
jgi:hypothetical protein